MRGASGVCAAAVLVIILEVSFPEFLEIQRASDAELRARYDLEPTGDPVVTGARGHRTKFLVIVLCDVEDVPDVSVPAPEPEGPDRRHP